MPTVPSQNELNTLMNIDNYSIAEIAERTGFTYNQITVLKRKFNLHYTKEARAKIIKKAGKKRGANISESDLRHLLIDQNKTQAEAAAILNTTPDSVFNYAKKYNIHRKKSAVYSKSRTKKIKTTMKNKYGVDFYTETVNSERTEKVNTLIDQLMHTIASPQPAKIKKAAIALNEQMLKNKKV